MIQIANPIPVKTDSALKRLKQARRRGLAFKPSPSVHPESSCYLLSVNVLSQSLQVDSDDLKRLLSLIGIKLLPGDFVLEPDTTLALRTAAGTRA